MTVAYIAIGSNLASPLEQVNAALKALGDIPESHILAVSCFTAPHRWGRKINPITSTPPWRLKLRSPRKSYSTIHSA